MLNEGEVKALDEQFEAGSGHKNDGPALTTKPIKGKHEQPTAAEVIAKAVALVHDIKSPEDATQRCEFAQLLLNGFAAKSDNTIDGIINALNRGDDGPLPSLVASLDRYIEIQRGIVAGVKDLSEQANAAHEAEHERLRNRLQDKFNAARGKVGSSTETKQ